MKDYLFSYQTGHHSNPVKYALVRADTEVEAIKKLEDKERSKYHYGDAYGVVSTAREIRNLTIE